MIYECDECGMQNEQAMLVWDEERQTHVCPDCGSDKLREVEAAPKGEGGTNG